MKVAVLMGGPSAEREVSIVSGVAVSEALKRLGHEVVRVDPSPEDYFTGSDETAVPGLLRAEDSTGGNVGAPGHLAFLALPELKGSGAVFIALHGDMGEDGRIQAALDLAGLPYTGSGAMASALSMNKDISKRIFINQGIPTPAWISCVRPGREARGTRCGAAGRAPNAAEIEALGGFPVVVKPNDQGSTIGLTVVQEEGRLSDAFERAASYSDKIIVESYIPGRELTVSILDGEALPVVEIIPEGGLYDYTRKYVKGKSRYVVPAELDPDSTAAVVDLGLRSFNALGCRGFGRVDLRLSPEGEPFCLEVNTIPGMTETSLVPMAAGAINVSFDQLVGRILAAAAADVPCRRGKE